MNELTQIQKQALTRDKNIVVTAGAGTGKTRVLVERYLDILINEDVDIKNVLAITFTNKAAAEMLERVAQKLDDRLSQIDNSYQRKKITNLRNRLSSAYISTIHSFCMRLLKEFPIEAGLDPDFSQMNDIQSDLLIEEAIKVEMEVIDSEESQWIEMFRLYDFENIKKMMRFSLQHRYEMIEICRRYGEYSVEEIYKKLEKLYLNLVNSAFDEDYLQQIIILVESIFKNDQGNAQNSEKAKPILKALEDFIQTKQVRNSEFWNNLFKLTRIFTAENKGTPYKNLSQLGTNEAWDKQTASFLLELSKVINPIYQWQETNPATPPDDIDRLVLTQMKNFYQLYQRLEQRYTNIKLDRALVDYDDLQLFVLKLLKENEEIRNKVANQFKYIMVDEFQDTNRLQWELISLLGKINENKFFIVGDPKQSIYGFRNADVRVFNKVKEQLGGNEESTSNGKTIVFEESFRFTKNLCEFINYVFTGILKDSSDNKWEVGYEALHTKREDSRKGKVEFALLDESENGKNQAEFITTKIHQFIQKDKYKYGDIAVLLRTRNHLTEVEENLRLTNIPFKTIGGIGFYQKQEIYDVYHIIRFLINPSDDLSLIGILRSPFANISDEALFFLAFTDREQPYWQKIQNCKEIKNLPKDDLQRLLIFKERANRWLNRRDRTELSGLLEEIFNDSYYRSTMSADINGDQILANLDKIIKNASDHEKGKNESLPEFAESLKRLINEQVQEGEAQVDLEDETTVKIMTIHQAKGLEFPVVFVPYLEQKLNTNLRDNYFFDEEFGLAGKVKKRYMFQNETYYLLDLLSNNQRQKELAELKRLIYVGCTRARDSLVLSATTKGLKVPIDTPLAWLMEALDLSPDDLQEGESQLIHDAKCKILTGYESTISKDESQNILVRDSINKLRNTLNKISDKTELPATLRTITDEPRGEIFSATQLMTFIQDREEYFKRYHLGFFEGDYNRLVSSNSEEDIFLLKGKIIHRYMENFPREDIENLLFKFDVYDEKLISEFKRELNEQIEIISKSKILADKLSTKESKNEISITMRLGTYFLTGTLDKIYRNESGIWEILDYKTNKISKDQVQQTTERYQTQIEVYALLLSGVFLEQDQFPVNLYFSNVDEIYQKIFNKKDLESVKKNFTSIIEEIKQLYYQKSS